MKNTWKFLYGIIILAMLLIGIGIAKETELWQVSGKLQADGSKVAITGQDVDEIKGWMTLDEVIKGYGLDKNEIYETFHLPSDLPVTTELKDIAAQTDEALSPKIIRDYIINKQQ